MKRNDTVLNKWKFALGTDESCLLNAKEAGAVHTWNVEEGSEDTWGTGWYEHMIDAPAEWKEKRIWVRFGAVYHDAVIYCNGAEIARHMNSGYTPFTVELTDYIKPGMENSLRVRVFSGYSEQMLPYMRSFDWANDGGMIREAHLFITGRHHLDSVQVTAKPVIEHKGIRQMQGKGELGFSAKIDGCAAQSLQVEWQLFEGADYQTDCMASGSLEAVNGHAEAEKKELSFIKYWHFDQPELYTLIVTLKSGGLTEDQVEIIVGFREFLAKESSFYLNGEKVRLGGTEWMPGSDPAYGMAEPSKQLEKMLVCLKESNCVFTRFHWQQDDFVLEWCDRHGILVQEEIPYWGGVPQAAGLQQWQVFREQMTEMIKAHGNHPSVIAWGVGNELDGQNEDTRQYKKNAVSFTHELDRNRTANYVSNSFYADTEKDGTNYGDIKMINEYTGTWMPDHDASVMVQKMTDVFPEKPLVISEFGLCEPAFPGGEERRTSLFLEKMDVYRSYPEVAGIINFCLNDYRTQMGEEGEGKMRRRIHGSTDIYGNPKPSYWVVQRECAPFCIFWEEKGCRVICRNDLPSYSIYGYSFRFADIKGMETAVHTVDCLRPGEEIFLEAPEAESVMVYRGNGDFAGKYNKEQKG